MSNNLTENNIEDIKYINIFLVLFILLNNEFEQT